MSYDFNANEILIMAEKIEENGAKFYREAADTVSDEDVKKMLLELAGMEYDHQKYFAEIRKSLSEKEKKTQSFDPDNEAVLYCKALADVYVFFKKEIVFSSFEEILKSAIVAEKDSIIFYLGIKRLIPKDLGQDKVESVIQEEMYHITILSDKLKTTIKY